MHASAGVAQPVPNEGSGLERILFGQIEDLFPWRNTGFPFGRNFQFLAFQFPDGGRESHQQIKICRLGGQTLDHRTDDEHDQGYDRNSKGNITHNV